MAVHKLITAVRERLFEPADAEVESWPISRDPALVLGILFTYWMFVYKIGPKLMQDRKPYDPKAVIQVYNIVQVIVCIGMVIWVSYTTLSAGSFVVVVAVIGESIWVID